MKKLLAVLLTLVLVAGLVVTQDDTEVSAASKKGITISAVGKLKLKSKTVKVAKSISKAYPGTVVAQKVSDVGGIKVTANEDILLCITAKGATGDGLAIGVYSDKDFAKQGVYGYCNWSDNNAEPALRKDASAKISKDCETYIAVPMNSGQTIYLHNTCSTTTKPTCNLLLGFVPMEKAVDQIYLDYIDTSVAKQRFTLNCTMPANFVLKHAYYLEHVRYDVMLDAIKNSSSSGISEMAVAGTSATAVSVYATNVKTIESTSNYTIAIEYVIGKYPVIALFDVEPRSADTEWLVKNAPTIVSAYPNTNLVCGYGKPDGMVSLKIGKKTYSATCDKLGFWYVILSSNLKGKDILETNYFGYSAKLTYYCNFFYSSAE